MSNREKLNWSGNKLKSFSLKNEHKHRRPIKVSSLELNKKLTAVQIMISFLRSSFAKFFTKSHPVILIYNTHFGLTDSKLHDDAFGDYITILRAKKATNTKIV